MKNYITFRCVLGILGSIIAIVLGAVFVFEGIKSSNSKGFLYGIPAIVAGCIGILICIVLFKKANKSDKDTD